LLQRGWGKATSSEVENDKTVRVTIRRIVEEGVTVIDQRPSEKAILAIGARPVDGSRGDGSV
jgi:hypothetical protein